MALAHITLATRNVDATAAFFTATLGWKPIQRPNNIGRPAAWLAIAPGQELHIVEVADYEASPFDAEFGRHFAFEIPGAEFIGLQERLKTQGAELIEAVRPTPFPRFFFRDPNGYIFEIVAAERQPEV